MQGSFRRYGDPYSLAAIRFSGHVDHFVSFGTRWRVTSDTHVEVFGLGSLAEYTHLLGFKLTIRNTGILSGNSHAMDPVTMI